MPDRRGQRLAGRDGQAHGGEGVGRHAALSRVPSEAGPPRRHAQEHRGTPLAAGAGRRGRRRWRHRDPRAGARAEGEVAQIPEPVAGGEGGRGVRDVVRAQAQDPPPVGGEAGRDVAVAVDRPLGRAGRPRGEQQVARIARPDRSRARVGSAAQVEVLRSRGWRALGDRRVVGHDEGRAEAGHRRPQPLRRVRGARERGDASHAGDGEEKGDPLRAVPQGQDDDVAPPDTTLTQPRGERARARGQIAQTPLAAGEPQRGPRAVARQRVVKERRRQVAPRCRWVHVAPGLH